MSFSVCLPATGINLLPFLDPNDGSSRHSDSNCIPATPDNFQQAFLGPLIPLAIKPALAVQAARWLITNPVGQVALAAAAYAVYRLNSHEDKPAPPQIHPAALPNPEQPQLTPAPYETPEPAAPADAGVAAVPNWRLQGNDDNGKDEPPPPVKETDAPPPDEKPEPSSKEESAMRIDAFMSARLRAGLPENVLDRVKQSILEYAGGDAEKAAQLLKVLLGASPQENTRRLSALHILELRDDRSAQQAVLQTADAAMQAGLSLDDYLKSKLGGLKFKWVKAAAEHLAKDTELQALADEVARDFVAFELAGTSDFALQAITLETHRRERTLDLLVDNYLGERGAAFSWGKDPRNNPASTLNQWRDWSPEKKDLAALEVGRTLLQATFREARTWYVDLLLYMRSLVDDPDLLMDDDSPATPQRLASELTEADLATTFIRGDLQKLEEDKKLIEQIYLRLKPKRHN